MPAPTTPPAARSPDIGSPTLAPAWFAILKLPSGLAAGFVGVTLSFTLRQHGASFAQVATMVGLFALPTVWKVVAGPFIDLCFTTTGWYVTALVATAASLAALGAAVQAQAPMPVIQALALATGAAAAIVFSCVGAIMAQTTPPAHRGAVAGWLNAGQLGGKGVGGGVALWIATSAGGVALAGGLMAAISLACMIPLIRLRLAPVVREADLRASLLTLWNIVIALLRTRAGLLVTLFALAPTGINEAASLFPAVAGEWHAPANLVALGSGVLGGLVTIPGCLAGGYLCRRFPVKAAYVGAALACAAVEVAVAFSPRTPTVFVALVLANALATGAAWAAISAVIFEILGPRGAATVNSLLSSAANVPIVVMAMVCGSIHERAGSAAMFLSEAAIACTALAALSALAMAWTGRRPAATAAAAFAP